MQNEKNRTRAVTDVIIILVLTILTGTILILPVVPILQMPMHSFSEESLVQRLDLLKFL